MENFLARSFDSSRIENGRFPFRWDEKPVPRFLESLLSFDHGSALSERYTERRVLAEAKRSERRSVEDFRAWTGMSAKGELMPMRAGAVNKRGLIKRLH